MTHECLICSCSVSSSVSSISTYSPRVSHARSGAQGASLLADDDRAVRVVQHVVGDGAEDGAAHGAEAARPHHDHVDVALLRDGAQTVPGVALLPYVLERHRLKGERPCVVQIFGYVRFRPTTEARCMALKDGSAAVKVRKKINENCHHFTFCSGDHNIVELNEIDLEQLDLSVITTSRDIQFVVTNRSVHHLQQLTAPH